MQSEIGSQESLISICPRISIYGALRTIRSQRMSRKEREEKQGPGAESCEHSSIYGARLQIGEQVLVEDEQEVRE